ncbi:MAG: hypothetical protein K2X02_03905 [Alphaproteobacteria bacterium]|nr:hypothetical protein [Alphaproteobacteria bacterium]
MKKEIFIWPLFILSCLGIFLLTLNFYHGAKSTFNQLTSKVHQLQQQAFALEGDISFVRRHENELQFLKEKGWVIPKSRLLAQEVFEKASESFDKTEFSFEPERSILKNDMYSYKITKIIWSCEAILDNDIFIFLEAIFSKFPGILILHEITLSRGEVLTGSSLLALNQGASPHFILGNIIFEWVAMDRNNP